MMLTRFLIVCVTAMSCLLPLSQAASGALTKCQKYNYPEGQYIDANKLKPLVQGSSQAYINNPDASDQGNSAQDLRQVSSLQTIDSEPPGHGQETFDTVVYISGVEGRVGSVCVEAPYAGTSPFYYYSVRMHNPKSIWWFFTFRLEMNGFCCISRKEAGLPEDGHMSSVYFVGSKDVSHQPIVETGS